MVVNHAGTLTQDYFKSYIKLVMNANECPPGEAKNITFKRLFGANASRLGKETYKNFLSAYEDLESDIS